MGLSMLDLISNALAGVIILFFILASSKFPGIPPERVCGNLVVSFTSSLPLDSSKSSVWARWSPLSGNEFTQINPEFYYFDSSINKLNSIIKLREPFRCLDSNMRSADSKLIPAIRCYQSTEKHKVVKHILTMHDPLAGKWEIGCLYDNHLGLLNSRRPDSVTIDVDFYDSKNSKSGAKSYSITAPTSSVLTILTFSNVSGLDTNFVFRLNPPR